MYISFLFSQIDISSGKKVDPDTLQLLKLISINWT